MIETGGIIPERKESSVNDLEPAPGLNEMANSLQKLNQVREAAFHLAMSKDAKTGETVPGSDTIRTKYEELSTRDDIGPDAFLDLQRAALDVVLNANLGAYLGTGGPPHVRSDSIRGLVSLIQSEHKGATKAFLDANKLRKHYNSDGSIAQKPVANNK